MPAGTIALTNNSTTVTGTGTSFTTELAANDFIVAVVGGVTYTLGVKSVDSATGVTLISAYGGPTVSAQAWTAVPNATLVGITAQVAADVAKAIRGLNLDKANWQQILSGTGTVNVTLPDGSVYSGPAWNSITTTLGQKANLSGAVFTGAVNANGGLTMGGGGELYVAGTINWSTAAFKATTRTNLGLGSLATASSVSRSLLDSETFGNLFATGGRAANTQGAGAYYFNNTPFGVSQYGVTLQFSNQATNSGAAGSGIWQHYLALGTDGNIVYAQNINNVYAAYTVKSTKNTTIDSNGFIKSASPVYRLCNSSSDTSSLTGDDFTIAGNGAANGEAAGVTATRTDTGTYQVSGSLGFATEGWVIEIPQDNNGNRLIFAETTVDDAGVITVKTYKRKFDVDTAMIVAGDAADIPDGRWVDLRLSMPVATPDNIGTES